MPDPINPSSASLVPRTEIRDVRLVEYSAVVDVVDLPEEFKVSLDVEDPQSKFHNGDLLIRVGHTVDFHAVLQSESYKSEEELRVAQIRVAHVAVFAVEGSEPTTAEIREFLNNNAIFMIHPYARAAIHRIALDVGLPSVVLPYLRRTEQQ